MTAPVGKAFRSAAAWVAGRYLALTTGVLGLSCLDEEPQGQECPPASPAFEVNIASAQGDIPPATTIIVTYGAGREEHVLTEPVAGPAVFCEWVSGGNGQAEAPTGGALVGQTAPPTQLHCALWTGGPAEFEMIVPGYEPITLELRPEQDACGLVTHREDLELRRPDTGSD